MVSWTHTIPISFRDSYGSGMGIVWGPRGPMSLGFPENPTNPSRYVIFLPKLLRFFGEKTQHFAHKRKIQVYPGIQKHAFQKHDSQNFAHKVFNMPSKKTLSPNPLEDGDLFGRNSDPKLIHHF